MFSLISGWKAPFPKFYCEVTLLNRMGKIAKAESAV